MVRGTVSKWKYWGSDSGLLNFPVALNTTFTSKRKMAADKCLRPWPLPLGATISISAVEIGESLALFPLHMKKRLQYHFSS